MKLRKIKLLKTEGVKFNINKFINFFEFIFDKENNLKNEEEYTFIWYKEINFQNKTHYTAPFRTKVKAKTFDEAKEKVAAFAMSKMKLVIMEETEYNKSKLQRSNVDLKKHFDEIQNIMNNFFTKI